MKRRGSEEKKSKRKYIFFILLFIIIVILTFLLITKKPREPSSGGVNLFIDKDAKEYESTKNDSETTIRNVAIPGWGSLTIPANKKDVIVEFKNPKENEGLYYLTFELRLLNESEQGYEVLYTSGLVEPGLYIQNITLARGLEKGSYDAILHVQPYRMDENKTPTNNADIQVKLFVK